MKILAFWAVWTVIIIFVHKMLKVANRPPKPDPERGYRRDGSSYSTVLRSDNTVLRSEPEDEFERRTR